VSSFLIKTHTSYVFVCCGFNFYISENPLIKRESVFSRYGQAQAAPNCCKVQSGGPILPGALPDRFFLV
jgi:hypothetical protein